MEDPNRSQDEQDEEPEVVADLDVTEEDAEDVRGGRLRNTEMCGGGGGRTV